MRGILRIALGFFALFNAGYKLATCANCPDTFFWFDVSGPVYIVIWLIAGLAIFYGVYKERQKMN